LSALASSGATTLVGLMVSDAWAQVRERVVGFFTRGGRVSSAADELALSRQELMVARDEGDLGVAADAQAVWRTHLRRVLLSDPAAVGELRALLADLEPVTGEGTTVVNNVVSGGIQYGPVVQGQVMSGLTFYSVAPGRQGPEPD
jgi:hypothetical protein